MRPEEIRQSRDREGTDMKTRSASGGDGSEVKEDTKALNETTNELIKPSLLQQSQTAIFEPNREMYARSS